MNGSPFCMRHISARAAAGAAAPASSRGRAGRSLIVLLLAFREADFEFDAPARVMQIDRNKGVSRTLDSADQLVDLGRVEKKLARARRIRIHMVDAVGSGLT